MKTHQITRENVIGAYRTLIASSKGDKVSKDIFIQSYVFEDGTISTEFQIINNKTAIKVSTNEMDKAIQIYNAI